MAMKIRLTMTLIAAAVALSISASTISAEDLTKEKKWDVNAPQGSFNDITINVTEGTWLNIDISPDGKEIVFDLLGDIYKMPMTGGKATHLINGIAWHMQPKFSPDGKYIAFTSDQ